MTSAARSFLKLAKRNAFRGMVAPGFKFVSPSNHLHGIHKIEKLIPRTGELIITTSFPESDKTSHWIIGIRSLQFHLESGVFKKLLV